MKKKKRLLAIFLAIIMLFSLIPASALAATAETPEPTVQCTTHSFDDYGARTPATCTESGTGYRQCAICGQGETYTIPALGHAWGSWYTVKQPTCIEVGARERKCTRCGATDVGYVPTQGHSWGEWYTTVEPTCTEEGQQTVNCTVCDATDTAAIPALGHDMGEWYIVRQPSEDALGLQQRDCSRCEYFETRSINMDGVVRGVDVSLTIDISGGPANGSYYSPTDDTASIKYFLVNNSDISISNLSIYFVDQTEGAIGYCAGMAPSGWTSGTAPYGLSPIESVELRYVQAFAEFKDGQDNSYTVFSNILALPVGDEGIDSNNDRSSAMYLKLFEPELPSIGFFTEGSQVHLSGSATAVNGDVYSADIGCGLNYYSCIAEDESVSYSVDIVISDSDCLNGYRDLRVFGCYYDVDGRFSTTYSNTIRIPCGIYGVESDRSFSLSLGEVSIPENYYEKTQQGLSPFYQEGETVWLQLLLCDPDTSLAGGNMDDISAELFMDSPEFVQLSELNGGSYVFADYNYVVTAADVKNGYIDAVGFANVIESDFGACQLMSNQLMIPCGEENTALEAELYIFSDPAIGSYFVPGEQVWLVVYVRNPGDTTVTGISVTDLHMGELGWIDSLPPGDEQPVDFIYTVTEADAENGYAAEFCKADGKEASAESNMLAFPCGKGILGDSKDVVVSKVLPSCCTPANGMYYTEGEYMEYYIHVMNCSDEAIYNVAVTDMFDPNNEVTFDMLSPGESASVTFDYKATAENAVYVVAIVNDIDSDNESDDVDEEDAVAAAEDSTHVESPNTGWLLNTAAVTWMDADGAYHMSTSNVVAAPTGQGNSVLHGDGETMCRTTLIGKTDGAYQYEQSLCPVHGAVIDEFLQLFDGIDSFEAYYEAYSKLRQLWIDSLNALYDEWFAAVKDEYYVAAVKDKEAFFAMLEAYEKALPVRGLDDEMTIDLLVSEMVRSKCLELCYELHTEPEPNPAALLQEGIPGIEAFISDCCSIFPDEFASSGFNFTDAYCEAHTALLDSALAKAIDAGNDKAALSAWSFARTIARAGLQKTYAEMSADLDDDSAALLREDSAKLLDYLTRHEETLKLYRSSEYSELSEAYVRGIIYRLASICMTQP